MTSPNLGGSWVFLSAFASASDCALDCALGCAAGCVLRGASGSCSRAAVLSLP
ncbi:MAG: hypothetical protein LBD94_02760 [Rickettsiales bacterium]|nr:hypothetical protein [Rickettsiales bacterium]